MLNIILFGAPGCGKGTQAARIKEKYNINHISTGEVIRGEIARGTELGKSMQSYIESGRLAPDSIVIGMIRNYLKEHRDAAGNIFDGFPRTIAQAEALEELFRKRGTELHAVIGLEVPEEELVDRMIKRGQETGRTDDNIDTIKTRLDVYHSQTMPLRDYYLKENKYIPVNGIGIVDEIFDDIAAGLEQATGVRRRAKKR